MDPHVHSLRIPRRPSTWICVTKTVASWSNILTNAVTLSKKDILGNLKYLQAAHGDSTASPLPPLRRQHVNLRDENRESVMQYYIFWLCCNPGTLRLRTSCKLRAYGRPIWRTVTICYRISFKNTIYKHVCSNSNVFRQYYPEDFCDHRWKI